MVLDRRAPFLVGWVRKYLLFGRPVDAVRIYDSMFCPPVVEGCDAVKSSKAMVSDLDQLKAK